MSSAQGGKAIQPSPPVGAGTGETGDVRGQSRALSSSTGEGPQGLQRGSTVLVRFEGGILVPATVKWVDGERIGLAFTSPVLLDSARV